MHFVLNHWEFLNAPPVSGYVPAISKSLCLSDGKACLSQNYGGFVKYCLCHLSNFVYDPQAQLVTTG